MARILRAHVFGGLIAAGGLCILRAFIPFCQGLPGSHHTLEERIDNIGTRYDLESSLPLRAPHEENQIKSRAKQSAKGVNDTCGNRTFPDVPQREIGILQVARTGAVFP
jgi:hypothetical protein